MLTMKATAAATCRPIPTFRSKSDISECCARGGRSDRAGLGACSAGALGAVPSEITGGDPTGVVALGPEELCTGGDNATQQRGHNKAPLATEAPHDGHVTARTSSFVQSEVVQVARFPAYDHRCPPCSLCSVGIVSYHILGSPAASVGR